MTTMQTSILELKCRPASPTCPLCTCMVDECGPLDRCKWADDVEACYPNNGEVPCQSIYDIVGCMFATTDHCDSELIAGAEWCSMACVVL